MTSIKQNCYRLLRLVNNIIDMSKLDNGYYDIKFGNYNIVSVVEDITMSILGYINDKGIELTFDTEMEEEVIACDPDKIERIVLNLLSNAIKYTEDGGKIYVNIEKDNKNVYISVIDSGIGIPEKKLNTIFERYAQVDNKLTRKFNGSGIGLSLVKSLVKMHQGDIYVESRVNEGTKFTIKLPIRQVESDKYYQIVKKHAESENAEALGISAATEEEIASMDEDERKEFLEMEGVEESGLDRLIKAAYHILGLRTFFTAGGLETRAWTFHEGMKAPQVAGVIHSDFERGFIRAEVVSFDDLNELETMQKVKEAGKLRLEGKDYVVQDGDIIEFRFNV